MSRNAVLYAGPSIDVLHEQYAKQDRIDERAPVRAAHEVHIDAPADRVWALLADPAGWPDIDPAIHDIRLDSAVAVDARFDWANGRARMSSRFAVLEPGHEITWTGRSGWFKAVHRHLLEPADGGTRLRCEESMSGVLLGLVFPTATLQAALVTWLTAVKAAAEAA